MSDVTTTNLKLNKMDDSGAAHENDWGTELNENFEDIDSKLGDNADITTTGGATVLNDAQHLVQTFQTDGVLGSEATIQFDGRGGLWALYANHTGNYALRAKLSATYGAEIPSKGVSLVYSDADDMRLLASMVPKTQCRLTKSGSNLLLSRCNGLWLTVDGKDKIIPVAGVTLAPTALTPSTTYYIYAYSNSGTLTLEASTTAYTTDPQTGMAVKTGDASRTFVGLARCVTGPAWADSATRRLVISYYNRRRIFAETALASDRSTTSTSAELSSDDRLEFLTWADEAVSVRTIASAYNTSGSNSIKSSALIDGSTTLCSVLATMLTANYYANLSAAEDASVAEGYHDLRKYGGVGGGTGYYPAATNGMQVGVMG